jgi:hypothetical protein
MDNSFDTGLSGIGDLNRKFIYNNEIDFSTIEGYDNSGNEWYDTDVGKFYMGVGVVTLAAIVLLLIKTHK